LIRHGETDWNATGRLQGRKNSELTPLGKEQAGRLADNLRHYHFDKVISSSSKRAIQTAGILAKKLSVKNVLQHDELCEINLGPWEGRFKVQIEREYPEQFNAFWYEPERFALPGAETFSQLQQRGIAATNGIAEAYKDREVLVVSHGAMIKSILCYFADRPLSKLWHPPKMDNCAHSIIEFKQNTNPVVVLFAGMHSW
jgi:probable phosphoglycerate mutase